MKNLFKKLLIVGFTFGTLSAFSQSYNDNGYDLPLMDSMTSEEISSEDDTAEADEIIMKENSYPSLDLSGELPKLDEMLQVYFGNAEDFVIEQELEAKEKDALKVKKQKYIPLKIYPKDKGYDLPEMDSIDAY